jgi:ornithine cyclodeaminase/alanine dehydrogenase-like protein (mu-crystallin family)
VSASWRVARRRTATSKPCRRSFRSRTSAPTAAAAPAPSAWLNARALGLHAQVEDDAHAVLEDADIVVTSVPRESEPRNFLDARLVPPGCYVAMACMGFSWDVATLGAFEVLATDDYDPATRRSNEKLAFGGPFHAEIAQLLAAPRAHDGTRRSALLFAGSGLADAAAAALIYRRAIERGLSQPLA